MVKSISNDFSKSRHWNWIEAFSKFGFKDGNGSIGTWHVANALVKAGYSLSIGKWGTHNILIYSLRKNGVEFIPDALSDFRVGYDDPREYLPRNIIEFLDDRFSSSRLTS